MPERPRNPRVPGAPPRESGSPGADRAESPARSALLAAWATAWLDGRVALDDVVAVVTGADEPHVVVSAGEARDDPRAGTVPAGDERVPADDEAVPADDETVPLAWALGRLRGLGAVALRAVLPVPGDVAGLPGPGAFSRAALETGEGVVVLGAGRGLVPRVTAHGNDREGVAVTVRWERHRVSETPGPALADLPQAAEADQALDEALREATAALLALDVARWRPEVAGALRTLREGDGPQRGVGALPAGHPARAVRLYARAERLRIVVELAADDDGGALVAGEARARREALAGLGRAVHRARLAAVNAPLERLAVPGARASDRGPR